MAILESTHVVEHPLARVFAFFRRPGNLPLLAPPELDMRILEAPEEIHLGARVTVQLRRWGMTVRVTSQVTEFEPNALITTVQAEGIFRRWHHRQEFTALPEGTRLSDHVEFEPPGGLLGLMVTPAWVSRDLEWLFAHRQKRLHELLQEPPRGA